MYSDKFKKLLDCIKDKIYNGQYCNGAYYMGSYINDYDMKALCELRNYIDVYFTSNDNKVHFKFNDLQQKKFLEFYQKVQIKDDFD